MAYTFVQSNRGTNTGNTTVSATYTSTATAGNLLVAFIATTANSTMTISGWNALTIGGASGGSARSLRGFWKIAAGTETTITSNQVSTTKAMIILEYALSTGVPSSPVDVENAATTVSGTTHTTPTVSAGASGGLVVWSAMTIDGSTWSNGKYNTSTTGVTNEDGTTSGTAISIRVWDQKNNVSGNNTGSGDSSGTVVGSAAIVVFKLPVALTGFLGTLGVGK